MKENIIFISIVGILVVSLLTWGFFKEKNLEPVATLKSSHVSIFLPGNLGVNPDVLFSAEEAAEIIALLNNNALNYKNMSLMLQLEGASSIKELKAKNLPESKSSFTLLIQTKHGVVLESGKVETTRNYLTREMVIKIKKGFALYDTNVRPYSLKPENIKIISGF